MNCYYHSEREAVGMCVSCGKPICIECKVVLGEKFYCNPCADKIFSGKLQTGLGKAGISAPVAENTSGQGSAAVIPKEIHGWNWGAFLLGWIWALGHKVWVWFFLDLVAYAIASVLIEIGYGSYNYELIGWTVMGWIILLIMGIVFGMKGNKWAWQNKRWDSIEHFKRTQKTWTKWGVGVFIFFTIIGILSGIIETFGTY